MTSIDTGLFQTIPLSLLNTPGDHRLQVALFFRKRLYVGVTSYPEDLTVPGVARMLRYYPGAERWETVYETPVEPLMMPTVPQQQFPLELGWRGLHITPLAGGSEILYATLLSMHKPRLLCSEDGSRFEELPNPGTAQPRPTPFGLLHYFQNWLFAVPVSVMSDGIAEKAEGGALLYVASDPHAGNWRLANIPGFGDTHNQVVHGLITFKDWLYTTVGNPFAGFQIWRTQADGPPPFTWELALDRGAHRYTLNSAAPALTVFQNALYVGTGIPETEPQAEEVAGAEIIRLFLDGCWELVMGKPRFSPIGLQIPVSTCGPGFDDAQHTLVAALASSEERLYVAVVRRNNRESAGFQIWETTNGEAWQPVISSVFDYAQAHSLRVLLALPKGLLAAGTWQVSTTDVVEPCLWFSQRI